MSDEEVRSGFDSWPVLECIEDCMEQSAEVLCGNKLVCELNEEEVIEYCVKPCEEMG